MINFRRFGTTGVRMIVATIVRATAHDDGSGDLENFVASSLKSNNLTDDLDNHRKATRTGR